ncbi:MAG TPA: CDP-diacylglycerol--glycerol-3-phosphate 3-phosphatidyltransferase [Blastocatellia bacterium]|nr:CDP-diacylglycerol--glycerol-3-phosphate 3-phosphatidyltransferase [Blastocatellia bacterium]
MNTPNLLTLLRIFIVPLLVVVLLTRFSEDWVGLPQHIAGVSLFLIAAWTDVLDGWLARRRQQVSRLGILLDPIADKLLISAAFISLVENRLAPAWAVVIVVGREFAVSGLRSIAAAEGWAIPASKAGKVKMFSQVVTIAFLITSSVDGRPPVETKAFPIFAFWTVPEMSVALGHLFGPGETNWLDWRVFFYAVGRGLLWLVVISSCWSMYGYFRAFYVKARENLGLEGRPKGQTEQVFQLKTTGEK